MPTEQLVQQCCKEKEKIMVSESTFTIINSSSKCTDVKECLLHSTCDHHYYHFD